MTNTIHPLVRSPQMQNLRVDTMPLPQNVDTDSSPDTAVVKIKSIKPNIQTDGKINRFIKGKNEPLSATK